MKLIIIIISLLSVLVVACAPAITNTTTTTSTTAPLNPSNNALPAWMTTNLKNVNTGESYTLADFKGQAVLVEAFAVWCPTCKAQQDIIKDARASGNDNTVHVSLDLDPNENEAKVLEHTTKNGFDWYYSVGSGQLTQELVAEFGSGIANPPSVPMILICEDQSFRFLGRGTKTAVRLNEEVAKGCSV